MGFNCSWGILMASLLFALTSFLDCCDRFFNDKKNCTNFRNCNSDLTAFNYQIGFSFFCETFTCI